MEICNFSGAKIYPGRGKVFIRSDSRTFRLVNGKCESHFLAKKNPRKYLWTVFYRKLHKKGITEEVAKKRTKKNVKVQRAIVGATWEQIAAKKAQPVAVRTAARQAAIDEAKKTKKETESKKKAEKVKQVSAAQKAAQKASAKPITKNVKSAKPSATSR